MSDYLSRAIERESAAAPTVRPALPSLFDPRSASPIVGPLEVESPSDDIPARHPFHETVTEILSRPEPAAVIGAPRTAAAVPPEPPRKSAAAARETSTRPVDPPVAPSVVAAFPPGPTPPAKQEQSPGAAGEPIVRLRAEAPARPAPAVAAQPLVRPPVASLPKAPGAASVAGEEVSPPAPARSAHKKAEPESGLRPALTPPDVVSPAPTTVPRLFPAPSSAGRASNSPAGRKAPSSSRPVHITIGRIEVRAVHSPPEPVPQRPAPSAPTKISLDDYLRRRRGNAA